MTAPANGHLGQKAEDSGFCATTSPTKLPSSSLHKGKLPINEGELQTWRLAHRPRSRARRGAVMLAGNWKQMQGCFLWWTHSPPPHSPPLSQIWTFTEADFMPGLPMNFLNSIEGPLSASGIMCRFRSPQEVDGWGGRISPAGGGRGNRTDPRSWRARFNAAPVGAPGGRQGHGGEGPSAKCRSTPCPCSLLPSLVCSLGLFQGPSCCDGGIAVMATAKSSWYSP